MARRRTDKPAEPPGDADSPKKSARSGSPLHAWIDEDLMLALDNYIDGTEPRVSKTSAVEAALRAFLRHQGEWPLRKREG